MTRETRLRRTAPGFASLVELPAYRVRRTRDGGFRSHFRRHLLMQRRPSSVPKNMARMFELPGYRQSDLTVPRGPRFWHCQSGTMAHVPMLVGPVFKRT